MKLSKPVTAVLLLILVPTAFLFSTLASTRSWDLGDKISLKVTVETLLAGPAVYQEHIDAQLAQIIKV